MRKTLMIAALVAAFGLAVAFGLSGTANAAPLSQSAAINLTNADIDALLSGADLDHRRPGRGGGELRACMVAVKAIQAACPCEGGEVDENGVVTPWGSHEAFMECVNAKAGEIKDNQDDPLPEECEAVVDKVVEKLGNSEIGSEGFECPSHDCPGGPRHPRGPRDPGGEG